ncbi:butyrophilin-like protein 1 isoform X1 [Mirounga leonina]|uniref:butyrophilin-like protein 1 isoform X1 n=1 Tax=Mirounga leonina TaxID=9715 RepID=UPI00156C41D9|nr:butyrophilin-like protein 1 isoform X1 [Mirounga leonina]
MEPGTKFLLLSLWVMDLHPHGWGEESHPLCLLQFPLSFPSVLLGRTLYFNPCRNHSPREPRNVMLSLELCTGRLCWHHWGLGSLPVLCSFSFAGVGSAPQVHITGVRVVCMASGWFPKPQVQWRAVSGEKFLTFSETQAQDAEGLFTMEATLVVRHSSSGNVTCSVLNPILGQEKEVAIFIPGQYCFPFPEGRDGLVGGPWVCWVGLSWAVTLMGCLAGTEPFFPRSSPWKLAFMVILTVLMFLLLGAAFYIMREHTAKHREIQEWEKLQRDKEEDQLTKEEALKARDELQADLALKKAQLYAGK